MCEGSQLILGTGVSQSPSDRNELVANIASIPGALGRPERVLADNGYANGDEVASLAEIDVEALVATGTGGRRRRHDFRPFEAATPAKEPKAEWLEAMAQKLASEEGRALYQLRQQTVEPANRPNLGRRTETRARLNRPSQVRTTSSTDDSVQISRAQARQTASVIRHRAPWLPRSRGRCDCAANRSGAG